MNVDKEVRRLVNAENAMAERDRKLAALLAEQEHARGDSDAAKERLALAMLRQRGVFDLPASQLVTLLSTFDVSVTAVHGAIITSAPPSQTEQKAHEPPVSSETVDVRVQISRNVAEAKRDLLVRSGLRWNGKAGQWIGSVDRSHVAGLLTVFGERVAIKPSIEAAATPAISPAPDELAVAPDAEAPSEAAPEARQAASDAGPGISDGEAGEAVREGFPAAPGGPGSALPVRLGVPRLPRFGSH